MRINARTRQILFKVVYYGPAEAGKTTNLQQIFRSIPSQVRSDMTVIDTEGDRTLFFDYFQMKLGRIGGFEPHINLYTVPGQAVYAATRRVVLRGADAVVFVADSAQERLEENIAMWQQMQQHLQALRLGRLPVIVQWNKRDLPTALPVSELKAALRIRNLPSLEAIALKNQGVRETLEYTIRQMFRQHVQAVTH